MRLLIASEGTLDADRTGYDIDSITWDKSTLPVFAGGKVVGLASGLERVDDDGGVAVIASQVVTDSDTVEVGVVRPRFDIDTERFEVSGPSAGRWIEKATLTGLDLVDSDAVSAATAILESLGSTFAEDDDEIDDPEAAVLVEGVIVIEGELTGDDRLIEPGALTWEVLPIPIIWDREDSDHTGETVGSITEIERRGNDIWASGQLSTSADEETQAAVLRVTELLAEGAVGVSIALDSEASEVRVAAEAVEEIEDAIEADEDGELPEVETDDEGRQVVVRWTPGEEIYAVTSARIRHVAVVDTPAFATAKLALVASGGYLASAELPNVGLATTVGTLTVQAHGADTGDYELPPADWFEMSEPDTSDPRVVWVNDDGAVVPSETEGARPWGIPLTVEGGRIYGHLASWQDCHTGFPDRCITPPYSESDYAWFHTGVTRTTDGDMPTGRITVDTDHANRYVSAAAAVGHYDRTGHAVADVAASNGELGPWLSGWVRPWASEQQIHELTSHPPSGDWRPRGRSTELIGVLCVNVPGFPLPRSVVTYRAGELTSLVASGLPATAVSPDATADPLAARVERLEATVAAQSVLSQLASR